MIFMAFHDSAFGDFLHTISMWVSTYMCLITSINVPVRDMTLYQIGQIYYNDVIMGTMGYQITSLRIVYSTIHSSADQIKHQNSASLAFTGIHWSPVNSPHKWPVTRKMFPFDVVIIIYIFPCIRKSLDYIHHKSIRMSIVDPYICS